MTFTRCHFMRGSKLKEYTIKLDDDAIFLYKKVAQMSSIPV